MVTTMRLLAFLVLLVLVAPAAWARDVVPAEKRILPYSANLPTCAEPGVLAGVASQFAEKEWKFWNSALTILEYDRIEPLAWRPWSLDTIPRRFCTARALLSDGRFRRVDYSVREDLDFIGVSYGIEFCVHGLDRNLAYSPACRMARP
jgi:hypothetical protein